MPSDDLGTLKLDKSFVTNLKNLSLVDGQGLAAVQTSLANIVGTPNLTTTLTDLNELGKNYKNVEAHTISLDKLFETFSSTLNKFDNEHGYANSRARLRMATLYQVAAANNGIVVGTGNKVEDFGVGFYTKYGDGGVDISPIADCTKTQVWELGKHLGVSQDIIDTPPTDGLWDDGRNDVQQLGMSYEDLEKAMEDKNDPNYKKYLEIREKNLHKMNPIPVCKFNE
mgnify:CR=1 FL=1